MIYSMTGYGKAASESNAFSIEAEVKSVNGRYLDIYLKIPSVLANKEYDLREVIKSKISRGKLSAVISIKKNSRNEEAASLNKEKLKEYLQVLKEIKKTVKINEKIKLEHILLSKEIFSEEEFTVDEKEFEVIKKTLSRALDNLLKMKKNEGKELEKDFISRIKNIEEKLELIEAESKASVNDYFLKLKERVKLIIENLSEYNDRMELELAILAEKSEITEECIRLRSHLKFFLESLEKDEEPGRKLNFLCQEMNREANTISSKTISTSITHNTVLIKEEIEKIREQLQNIE